MKVSGKRTKQLTASIMATLVFGGGDPSRNKYRKCGR